MWTWLAVGVGGALGAMARHGVNRVVLDGYPALRFPIATLFVNVLGSCVFGVPASRSRLMLVECPPSPLEQPEGSSSD